MSENINKMALLEILVVDDDPGSLQLLEKRTLEVRELSKALTVAEQRERRRMSHLLHDDLL